MSEKRIEEEENIVSMEGDGMERDVEEENELVTLWINDRELDVKKILNSKEVLNCYFQKFQLDKPVYQVRVVNEDSTQYRIFMLTLELMAKRLQYRGKVKESRICCLMEVH